MLFLCLQFAIHIATVEYMAYKLQGTGDFLATTSDQLGNADLVTIDAENVITLYKDPTLRSGALTMLEQIRDARPGRRIAIATNNSNGFFVEALTEALPVSVPVFSGVEYANKKRSPDMFLAAAEYFGVRPEHALHIDDQLLSHRGARLAGFAGGILVKPYGSTKHFGVKVGRVADTPVRVATRAQAVIGRYITDGLDY